MAIIRLLLFISLINISTALAEPVGEVKEVTGPTQIEKQSGGALNVDKGTGVESMDTVVTADGRVNILFVDDTQVAITENSKLLIDEYVFDPATSNGKLSLKIAEGTVRYASGLIAHKDNTKVDIQTPTATIGVRGTDFTMTVNEVGESLIILLPDKNGKVGKIEVSTAVGTVILDKAFQATVTISYEKEPTKPVILDLDESQISNTLILQKPKEATDLLLLNPLDEDLLDFEELKKDLLKFNGLEFSELDINELDVNPFFSGLEVTDTDTDGKVAGFNQKTGVYTFIQENTVRVVRTNTNTFDFNGEKSVNQKIELTQGDATNSIITVDKYQDGNIIIIKQQ